MKGTTGFTLVEILIVVVLLGILAAVVIPTVSQGATAARESSLICDLQLMRRVILVYKAQHLEVAPGNPNGHASPGEAFAAQATKASSAEGQTAEPGTTGYDLGPYLLKVPENPFNKLNSIRAVDAIETGNDTAGWQYNPTTGEIRADTAGYETY
jgi:prepilin-type N-terminal cleavage/methylation domain-containing protein